MPILTTAQKIEAAMLCSRIDWYLLDAIQHDARHQWAQTMTAKNPGERIEALRIHVNTTRDFLHHLDGYLSTETEPPTFE